MKAGLLQNGLSGTVRSVVAVGAVAVFTFAGGAASAATITEGFTFAVASGGDDTAVGTHLDASKNLLKPPVS